LGAVKSWNDSNKGVLHAVKTLCRWNCGVSVIFQYVWIAFEFLDR